MTATEIIREIRRLSPVERAKVVQFTSSLAQRELSDEALLEMTERMIDATDPAEGNRLQEEIVRGFYGRSPEAAPLADDQLTGRELGALAKEMVETTDPAKKAELKEAIVRGFYGSARHA